MAIAKECCPALLFWIAFATQCSFGADPVSIRPGDRLPVQVPEDLFAEAESPTGDLAASGGGFWIPGPERLCGWAIRDLREVLQKVTRAQHPLVRGTADTGASPAIVIGTFDAVPGFQPRESGSKEAYASVDPEAFLIETQDSRVFLLGKSRFGLIAGIYGFLDRLGCRWYAPGAVWESLPRLESLAIDHRLNASSTGPSYHARHFFCSWGPNSSTFRKTERQRDYALWCLRNRMGGSAYTASHHNEEILPPGLFNERPELFAKITTGPWAAYAKNGRLSREIARGKPEVVQLAVQSALKYFETNEGKGSYYNSFSLETGDGIPACEESLARIGNHTPTDLNFWFANQVAAGIEKAGLKDRWVGMLSYSDHSLVPTFDLHPRVAVTVTTGLADPSLTVEQRLEGFRNRKAQRLGVYDYLNLITWTRDRPGWSPASKPLAFAAGLKRWHEHGARTYIAETSDSWVCGGPAHYLASRMMWDISADPAKALDAYYKGAFGEAAESVRCLHNDWETAPKLTRAKLAQWHDWITTAEQRIGNDPESRARVTDLKRYYLYCNLVREFEIDLTHPKVPSKRDRYLRLLRYVGSNRGEGAFHALGLFLVLAQYDPATLASLPPIAEWGEEFEALAAYNYDESAWAKFPPIPAAEIDRQFLAVRLPLDNVRSQNPEVLDPVMKVFPATARPPVEIQFPKLHGPPGIPRHYLLQVIAPTPRLTLEFTAGNPLGGGVADRTCIVTDPNDNELKTLQFKIDQPQRVELNDLQPGLYTVTFPEFGAEQLTVRGGNTFGAVRSARDFWGFNPFRSPDKEEVRAYFLVPPGRNSLKVGLTFGQVSLGFVDGALIAPEVKGDPKLRTEPVELPIARSDAPRIAFVQWRAEGNTPTSEGMQIEGVTAYTPDASAVFHESLD